MAGTVALPADEVLPQEPIHQWKMSSRPQFRWAVYNLRCVDRFSQKGKDLNQCGADAGEYW